MSGTVNPIPEGHRTVTPYLVVEDARALLRFVEAAFDARLTGVHEDGEGRVMHAEARIGDSAIMVGESNTEWPPSRAVIHLYMEDVDAVYRRALDAGATSLREPENMFYGDRSAGVTDPSGTQWWIATHVEDVSAEEMARRQAEGARG